MRASLLLLLLLCLPARAQDEGGLDRVPMPALRDAMRGWDGLARAWFRLQAGDAPGALADARGLTAQRPASPDAWHFLGIAAAADQRPRLAERALRRSLRKRPDGWAVMHLVQVLLDRGQADAADRAIRKFGGRIPTDLEVRRAAVAVLVARDQLDAARSVLTLLEAEAPGATTAYQLAVVLEALGDVAAATDAAQRAVGHDPADRRARLLLLSGLQTMGRWNDLLAVATAAEVAALGEAVPAWYRGVAQARLGQTAAAVESFDAAGRAADAGAGTRAASVAFLLQLGAPQRAEGVARRALGLDAADARVHHLLAMALSGQQREAEALAHYRRAADLAADNAAWRFDLLASLCGQGLSEEAVPALERARKDFPDDARWDPLAERCGP